MVLARAATVVESRVRRRQARSEVAALRRKHKEEIEAAVVLESRFRGKQARLDVDVLRKKHEAELQAAAALIQSDLADAQRSAMDRAFSAAIQKALAEAHDAHEAEMRAATVVESRVRGSNNR